MIESVASGNSKAVENYSAADVLPDFFESEAKKLIVLIKEYYKHLNSELGPSFEISNLVSSHDIDLASEKYLDAIERVIAPNIPQSETLDRQRLFKIIANYYTNRGSEESIYTFFKIFYNEVVTLIYPKDFIFHTSDDKSVSSDKFKLRDSYRYQEFSYLISSNRDAAEWKSEFKKFVHPAGLKFFTALTITAIGGDIALETMWNDGCGVLTKYLKDGELPEDPCDFWESIDWEKAVGKHSPLFQPCVDTRLVYVFTVLYNSNFHYIEYLRNTINSKCPKETLRAVYASYAISLLITDDPYGQVKRWDDIYRGIGKYLEHGAYTDGYSDYTIGGTELDFDPGRTVENGNTRFAGWSYDTSVDDFSRSYTCNIDPNVTPIVDINSWIDLTDEIIDTGDRKKVIIGNSIDTSLSVVHNFNTYNIIPLLKNNTTGQLSVHSHVEITDTNTVLFNFASPPDISEYSAYIFAVDQEKFSNGYVESFEGSETIETNINGGTYWVKDIIHNLSHDKLLFSVRDLETNEFIEAGATYITNDILQLTFAEEPGAAPGGYYVTLYYKQESNDFSGLIGNGIDTEIIVDHGIGTEDVVFSLKEVSTGEAVQFAASSVIDIDNIKLEFNSAPSQEQYEIYIKQGSSTGILQDFISSNLGDGTANSLGLTHNLGTLNVIPVIRNTKTNELNVNVQWEIINENIIIFTFGDIPKVNEYYVTIFRGDNNVGFTESFDGDDTIINGNDYVLIEDINNPSDGPYGSVSYDYEIAKFEIKKSDIELWWGSPLPITGDPDSAALGLSINQYSRYINWLNTRYGYQEAYNFTTSNGNDDIELWPLADSWSASNRFRHKDAKYFMPNEDEWYKAAYYDPNKNGEGLGGYYEYPTGSDVPPIAVASGTVQGTAVFDQDPNNDTVASVYEAGGLSSYGTMGQGGNAYEYLESAFDLTSDDPLEERTIRGGAWGFNVTNLSKSTRFTAGPSTFFGQNITLRLARNPNAVKINSGNSPEPKDNSIWTYNVNHNLNSENVIFAVSGLADKQNIIVSGRTVDANNLELSFNEKPELFPNSLKVSVFYSNEPSDTLFTIGDGINNEIDITHNMGTEELVISVREISTGDVVYVYGKTIDADTLRLVFEDIPTTGQYQIYIKSVEYIRGVIEYGSALDGLTANDTFNVDSDYLNSLVYFEPGPTPELICWYATESNSN